MKNKELLYALREFFNGLDAEQKKEFKENDTDFKESLKDLEKLNKLSAKQKEKEVGNFFKTIKNKVAPIVAAALVAVSPLVLTGCDLENQQGTPSKGHYDFTPSVTENMDGTEVVTDKAGNEYVLDKVRDLADWSIENLKNYFADRTMQDIIDKRFTTQFNKNLEEVNRLYEESISSDKNSQQIIGSYITGETFTLPQQTDENAPKEVKKGDFQNGLEAVQKYLMGNKVNYAVHITNPRDKTGSDLTYYRKGSDTAVFVIKQGSNTYLNGIYEGEFYTDGQDYFPEWFSFALNEQKASLLRQADITGAEFGDEILASLVSVHKIKNVANKIPNRTSSSQYKDSAEDAWYSVAGYGIRTADDGSVIREHSLANAKVKFIRDGRVESISFTCLSANKEETVALTETLFQGYLEYQPQQSKIIAEEPQK